MCGVGCQEYSGLIVRSETKVTAQVLEGAGHRLKVVARAGTGVDNIDVQQATDKGILVINAPGGNSISACELTCSLITSLARHVPQGCQSLKEGRWERKMYRGVELAGKTLAVLGLGRIGREVALRMSHFGMHILGYDPCLGQDHPAVVQVEHLDELWPRADFITVHTPLLPHTTNLVSGEVLMKKCKVGVAVVNAARGGIVDEGGLLEALEAGRCGGAALDVFSVEPPTSDPLLSKLIAHPNVIATPHLGASTEEAQKRVALEIAEQLIALVDPNSGYKLSGVVNAPWMSAVRDPGNWGRVRLGSGLGRLGAALWGQRRLEAASLRLGVTPAAAQDGGEWLEAPVLAALLSGPGSPQNGLSVVNAPAVARRLGITTSTETVEAPHSPPSLTLTIATQDGFKQTITGILRGEDSCLVSIDGAVFTPCVAMDDNTLLFASKNPAGDCPLLMSK
ncbi:hypothetical protein AAG570_004859 [Ranatra chinensis]|uniref:D-3-phosphoglycerate dehydrogenase n=1 Tax=Ranatra chinensis TaxID=642074 RepID=A0ABD0Y0D9_9HEMI